MAAFPAASIGRQTCERFTEWFPSGRVHCNGHGKTAQLCPFGSLEIVTFDGLQDTLHGEVNRFGIHLHQVAGENLP